MNHTHILSVILPCYNVHTYLQKCIDSIFANNVDGIELIFIDDGSTDIKDPNGIASYFNQPLIDNHSEFDYNGAHVIIIRQENKGVSAARNRGIQAASGKYILFIDPDDLISKDWFESVISTIQESQPDVFIYAFQTFLLDNHGAIISKWLTQPMEKYNTHSNRESVQKVFPNYLGYSVSNVQRWAAGERLQSQLEFGAVWRNVYRKEFLLDNNIKFSDKIKLNEDSIFNAYCCLNASHIIAKADSHYNYICRSDGTLRSKINPNKAYSSFLDNKIALAHERQNLIATAKEKGYPFSTSDIAGSCVLSVFEILLKFPLCYWGIIKKYIYDDVVVKSIKLMPFVGKPVFDIPLFILKCHLAYPMFLLINFFKKIGIDVKYQP